MANGLINLQTDLKSLRYGSETPYITKDINNAPSSNQIGMQVAKRIDDTSRIAQMLVSKPGFKYLANEALLQQIDVANKIKNRGNKSIAGAVLSQVGGTFVNTVKIVGSTLAQVPVNGTGTHFLKGFRTNTYLQPSGGNTRSKFAQFFGAGGVEGAPLALEGKPIEGKTASNFGYVNSVSGEFTPDVALPLGYGGRVDKRYDEKLNKAVSRDGSNKASAKNGSPINVGNFIVDKKQAEIPLGDDSTYNPPSGTSLETTATPGVPTKQNLINSISNTGSIAGDVNPDSSNNILSVPYSYDKSYAERSAKTSINNAQAGAPIPVRPLNAPTPSQQVPRETTVAKNYLGSIAINASESATILAPPGSEFVESSIFSRNKSYAEGEKKLKTRTANDVGGKPIDIKDVNKSAGNVDRLNDGNQNYSDSTPYTGRSTTKNISSALAGKSIFSSVEGQDYTFHNETSYGEAVLVGDTEPGNIGEETSLGKQSIPKETSLKKLREDVNLGSAEIVFEDFKTTQIQDFRLGSKTTYSYDYNAKTVNKEQRISLGNQGKSTSKSSYMTVDPLAVDKLNAQDISTTLVEGVGPGRDFAKFHFEIITPDGSKFLHFRAFIDSIDDSYNADWQGRKYNGRAENFYTYGGFDRDISVSFNIAAASRSEMKPLYRKMVYLASATAPTYGPSGLMRGTLAKLTIGSYLAQIPGVLTSVKFSLDNNTPWEIAMGNPDGGGGNSTDDDVQELPMMLKCSISFKPIHNFAPQTGLHHFFTSEKPLNGSKPFFTNGETIT